MRKTLPLLFAFGIAAVFASGCANVENKFGRGMSNTYEIVRGGEFRRSMEQSALANGGDFAYTTGFIHGVNRTLGRTGIGVYEVITAPFPPYGPVATDTELGYSGGDVVPFLPGVRFRVFDMH